MNKSATAIIVVIGIIIIALLVWFGVSRNGEPTSENPTATSTENTPTPNPSTPPASTLIPGSPKVVTSAQTSVSDTTAVLTGSVVPNGAQTNYWYDYGITQSMDKVTTNQNIGSGYASIPTPGYLTGLAPNTTYFYRLSARNQYGTVSGLQYSFKTTQGNPPPTGSKPTAKTVAASDITRTAANLNGEVVPNRGDTWYWFEYGKTANFGNTTSLTFAGNDTVKHSTSASLSSLDPLTTYYFRLNAQNQYGTVNGVTLNFKTLGPSAPSAPTAVSKAATDVSTSTATLNGDVTPNGLATTYWFEYSTDSLLGSVLLRTTDQKSAGTGTDKLSVDEDLTGLSQKTNYYFRLVAQNNLGTVRGDRQNFKTK